METPLPNDYVASSMLPVGHICSSRKDWLKAKCSNNVLNIITNGYILSFITKQTLARSPDHLRIQGPPERPSSGLLFPVSPDQEHNRRVDKVSYLGFTVVSF